MNIEVGEYIRTKNGRIGKLDKIYYAGKGNRYYGEDLYKNYYSIKYNFDDEFGRYSDEEIVKHSKNIIDLIEVGDYVNGEKIQFINRGNLITEGGYDLLKKYKEISTIVTKEQFRNIEYKAKK